MEPYRSLSPLIRIVILVFIGIILFFLMYNSELSLLQEELNQAVFTKEQAEQRFLKIREIKENLPELERLYERKEKELEIASKKLPDNFIMDNIIQKTALIAQETGIVIKQFDPGRAVPSETAFRYAKMPIKIEVHGRFNQIAQFFDQIVHLDLLMHVKNIQIGLSKQLADDVPDGFSSGGSNKDYDKQRSLRMYAKAFAFAELIVFRSLSQNERSAIDQAMNGAQAVQLETHALTPSQVLSLKKSNERVKGL